MFKLVSCMVAGAIVLAPLLPAQAGGYYRSSGFGVSIGTPGFGVSVGAPFGRYRGFRNEIIPRRSFYDPYIYPNGYQNGYYPGGVYSPGFGSSTVIVAPRAVIINPGYSNYYNGANCGSVIYGSPIASPVPVDPFTGLACR